MEFPLNKQNQLLKLWDSINLIQNLQFIFKIFNLKERLD
jgi:hypothetical protein